MGRTKEFFKWAGKTVAGKLLGEAFGWKTVAPVLASLWAALRELQRLHRNGVDLTRTVALKEPYYGTKIVKREAVQSTDFLSE
jgi:hypothetical protein